MAESSVKCEISIIGAKNIVTKRQGSLFIRCYLSVGKNQRIKLNTREIISSKKNEDNVFWDETFSLECSNGTDNNPIHNLAEQKIGFELRWRNTSPNFIGQMCSSKLLAYSEIPWKNVFEAKNMEIHRWVSMTRNGAECCDMKPPALQVEVKVEIPSLSTTVSKEEMRRRRRRQERLRNWDECGCGRKLNNNAGFCCCADNELFLVAAVVDVF